MARGIALTKFYGQCGSSEQPRPLPTGGREPCRSFQAAGSGTKRASSFSASRGLLQLPSNHLIWAKRRRCTVPQLSVDLVSEYRGQSSMRREALGDRGFVMDSRCDKRVTKAHGRIVNPDQARGHSWGEVVECDGAINHGGRGERLTDSIAIVDRCQQEQGP